MSTIQKPTESRIVTFTPSDSTKEKFKKTVKENYPAMVTKVNDDSVHLTVKGVGEEIYAYNVPHSSEAAEGRSHWDWPARVEEPGTEKK